MNSVCVIDESGFGKEDTGCLGVVEGGSLPVRRESVRWTTRQVMFACLWSTLFGVVCGYAWLFLQGE